MGGNQAGNLIGAVRVLLVEDERASALVIEQHLASIRSVRCLTDVVGTLASARERLGRERYDLVLADLHLPDSAAADTIVALVRACDHPVIALTVDEDPELRRGAIDAGAFDFLLKSELGKGSLERPVRLAALQARTLESLRRSEERFRKLTELSSDWYWEQDADFRLTFMSTLLGTTTGLNPSAYLGRRRWEQPALNLTEADWARHRGQIERHEPFRDFEMQRPSPGPVPRFREPAPRAGRRQPRARHQRRADLRRRGPVQGLPRRRARHHRAEARRAAPAARARGHARARRKRQRVRRAAWRVARHLRGGRLGCGP